MVADQGEVGDLETTVDVPEEAELGFGRVLNVITYELNEVGSDQAIDLADSPVRVVRTMS